VRWVVDGQQRITSLACALTERGARDKRYCIWFDPDDLSFHSTPATGPHSHWVSVWRLLDAAELGDFLYGWGPAADGARRRALLEAGKRIREYPVLTYTIESDDVHLLREVFRRSNEYGRSLKESDIFNALVGSPGDGVESLRHALRELPWGVDGIKDDTLMMAVKGILGQDPTHRIKESLTGELESRYAGAIDQARWALPTAVDFLRADAGIPHRRLLPYRVPLIVLARFFSQFPHASAHTRRLLRRWVWRGILSGAHQDSDKTRLRASLKAIRQDENRSAVRLLDLVPERANEWQKPPDKSFDARSAVQRVGLLALASLQPRMLGRGGNNAAVEIPALLDAEGARAIRLIHSGKSPVGGWGVENRVVHPPVRGLHRLLVQRAKAFGTDDIVLRSHGIDSKGVAALVADDRGAFLRARLAVIERIANGLGSALAEWHHPARRPLVHALLAAAE
jgi:hypothetical protein